MFFFVVFCNIFRWIGNGIRLKFNLVNEVLWDSNKWFVIVWFLFINVDISKILKKICNCCLWLNFDFCFVGWIWV